ncbi:uncharacterized protein LOC107607365 [Arachis ipaensis]|uniref:uncharacterized protein LOC107607365 n=1 Tax=Arachis ipaensis TaxID=130454 RepID=UPI0007AF8FDD|nr:uncharacterized protein LOC107607365 [Arachis ipaensis]
MEDDTENNHEGEVNNHAIKGGANPVGQERRVLGSYINPNPGNYASKWLESFPKESLTTWEDVMNRFLTRFYPPQRVNRLRTEVQTFRQQNGETLYEAWERFKDLTKKCPRDMFNEWEEVVSNLQNQDASTQKFEAQIRYLSKQALGHSSGNAIRTTSKEECKAITLKSEKELKETLRETQEEKEEGSSNAKEEAQTRAPNPSEEKEVLRPYVPKAPYPQRLMKNTKDNQFSKFLEIFKRLQINIPFAEALEQMPLYAKFLKELMTKKRS